MKIITQLVEERLRAILIAADNVSKQSNSAFKQYWSTGIADDLGALASGDAATMSSKLTKALVLSGYGFAEQAMNFFGGSSVVKGDHLQTVYSVSVGKAARSEILTESVEAFGDKMKILTTDALWLYGQCVDVLKIYFSNYVDKAIGSNQGFPDNLIVFGAEITKADMVSAVVLSQQFVNLCNDQDVVVGDYGATLAKWKIV